MNDQGELLVWTMMPVTEARCEALEVSGCGRRGVEAEGTTRLSEVELWRLPF